MSDTDQSTSQIDLRTFMPYAECINPLVSFLKIIFKWMEDEHSCH